MFGHYDCSENRTQANSLYHLIADPRSEFFPHDNQLSQSFIKYIKKNHLLVFLAVFKCSLFETKLSKVQLESILLRKWLVGWL